MKELEQFFDEVEIRQPKKGMAGVETDWKPLDELTLKGSKFLVCDFQFIPSEQDGVSIQTLPGKYNVEVKGIDFGGDRRISRLRVFRQGTKPALGKIICETWTDTSYSAVCDFDYFSKEWDSLGEDAAGDKLQEEYGIKNCGVFRLSPDGSKVPYVSSGFGDGTFSIFELCDGKNRAGFEIEFIPANEPYPFQASAEFASPSQTQKEKGNAEIPDATWSKFGQVLEGLKREKSGDQPVNRKRLEDAFNGFMRGIQDQVVAELEPLRRHFQQVRRKSLPLTAEYHCVTDISWLANDAVAKRVAALQEADFQQIGCFQSTVAPSVKRVGFIHPKNECTASVIQTKSHTSLYVGYEFIDETNDEFTDNPSDTKNLAPPWVRYVSRPDLTASELIKFAEKERRSSVLKTANKGSYAEGHAKSWSRLMAWRAETGGLPRKYFEDKFYKADDPESKEKVDMMHRDEVEKSLCNWLRLQQSLPFKIEHVLDSIVIIHDELSSSNLTAAWWCGTNDIKMREADFSGANPRQVFAEVNQKCGNKLRLVLEKTSILAADFYLPAES